MQTAWGAGGGDAGEKKDQVVEEQMVKGFREWENVGEEERRGILLKIKRKMEDLETLEG